jgi:cadmium resistance protein CadD (predicted permease)
MLDVLVLVAAVAFAATDIDDLFLLMMFFSSRIFPPRQVALGQFIVIHVIGLLGLVPIALGIKDLIEVRNDNSISSTQMIPKKNKSYLAFLTVAAVTVSNGGDNIGVYVPLFSKYNTVDQITMLTSVFIAMTAVWCVSAYYLSRIRHTGNIIMPFVLIGLGIYILIDSFLLI